MLSTYTPLTQISPLHFSCSHHGRIPTGSPLLSVPARLGPEEYVETDYEYKKSDEEMEEVGDIEEVPSEPYSPEMIHDHLATPEDPTDRMRSLEEEVATLKH
ncbi:unnamed protein product [Lactuca saligna]|uniref:Uncharacterized protein n=1 Tax=Lactuca saligna TaxID=75948 RepID=A0AA35ZSX1_LACSI|nr:unnamed protein product [Lactuca saligna]